jgi:hypothetical protein
LSPLLLAIHWAVSHLLFSHSHQMNKICTFISYIIQQVIEPDSVHFTMNLSNSQFPVGAFGFLTRRKHWIINSMCFLFPTADLTENTHRYYEISVPL